MVNRLHADPAVLAAFLHTKQGDRRVGAHDDHEHDRAPSHIANASKGSATVREHCWLPRTAPLPPGDVRSCHPAAAWKLHLVHEQDHSEQADSDATDAGPSRTQQRREALAILALAGQLVEMQPARLARLDLPQDLRDEIANYRRMHSHIARKRQLAFLAKKMRRHEDGEFDSVRAELGDNRDRQRQDNATMHRLEALRDQLVAGDESALSEFINEHPQVDRQHLRSLLRKARSEKENPTSPPRAYREIFQLLQMLSTADDKASR